MRWKDVVSFVASLIVAITATAQESGPLATRPGGTVAIASPSAIGAPDLTPYTPSGWDAPVVVSSVVGTHTQTVPLPSGATAYLDFAVVNQGDVATAVAYYHRVYVDDVLTNSWYTNPPQNAGYWAYIQDYSLGVLADGLHRVRLVIDEDNAVAESDETNNVFELYVGVGAVNLQPYKPGSWDDKIVVSTVTGTSTDALTITPSDTVYVDWAMLNAGPGGLPVGVFVTLWLDGVQSGMWATPRMSPNYYTYASDWSLGSLSAGGHTLRIAVDSTNLMPESDEYDNEYIRTFTVSAPSSPQILISPTTLPFGSTGAVSASGVAAEDTPAVDEDRGIPAEFVDPNEDNRRNALREKAAKNGTVRVIARLDVPFVPEGKLTPPGLQKQRREIRAKQARAIQALQAAEERVKRFETIPFFAAELDAHQLARLERLPDVVDIVEDATASPSMASSNAVVRSPIAWAAGFDGAGQAVAVLDTGVSKTHPYFATGPNKIVEEGCYSSTTATSTSLCPGGVPSSTASGSGVNCPTSVNGCDHGTHVAGTVAGNDWTGPDFGVARGADLIAIQVFSRFSSELDCGTGMAPCALSFSSDQIRALERVLALHGTRPIAAVNMSLGHGRYTSRATCDSEQFALKAAIDNLNSVGIATVAATGNNSYLDATAAPACISTAVAVSATTDADLVPGYANVASWVAMVAPGDAITSSVPGGTGIKWGTSMAAPHVAGAWAVMKQVHPDWTRTRILDALRASATSVSDTRDSGSVKDLRRLDIGAAALGTAKAFLIQNYGGSTLNVAPITAETPAAWVSWSPTGSISIPAGGVAQVRVTVNLALAPVGLSVTRLLVASNDVGRSPYPDGVFIVVDRDPVPAPPTNLTATAPGTSSVNVSWTGVSGATNYHVYRSGNGSSWTMVGAVTGTSFTDEIVLSNHAYLYKVRSYAMVESADSNKDVATTVAFTDPMPTGIPVRAIHWTQLLTAVNAVRAMTGLPAATFTAPAPTAGVAVRRQHLIDLRSALAPARTALGLPAVSYTDPTITAAVTAIKAAHVTDLRLGVR